MEIRPITAQDAGALSRFFARMPDGDRTFLKEDVDDPQVVDHWVLPDAARSIAVDDGEVVGSVAVVRASRLVEPCRRNPARSRS